MAQQYGIADGYQNLPQYEGYNPKEIPSYQGPSAGMLESLNMAQDLGGPNADYSGAVSRTQDLLNEPGTLRKLGFEKGAPGLLRGLKHFIGGGADVTERMKEASKIRDQQAGKAAWAELGADSAARGGMGGTVAGIKGVDLADRYSAMRTESDLAAEMAGENITQGRFGLAAGVGSKAADVLQKDWTGRTLAEQNLAQLGLSRRDQELNANRDRYGMEKDIGMMPYDYASDMHNRWNTRSDTSSGWDVVGAVAGAAIPNYPW